MEVETTGGVKLKHHTKVVGGTVDNPMAQEEVETKARRPLKLVLSPDEVDAMVQSIWNIEQVRSVREFRRYLQCRC